MKSPTSLFIRLVGNLKPYFPLSIIAAIALSFWSLSSPSVSVTNKPLEVTKYITNYREIPINKYPKILVFVADINNRGKGKLLSLDAKTAQIDGEFKAISGVGGIESQSNLGPIPSTVRVSIDHYTVETKALYLAKKGIEGNFYKINPHLVNIEGNTRGDFGVHLDANVPGTAGCVGIPNMDEWEGFKKLMKSFNDAGLKSIPLIVAYY